jgi:hypothetical protein
VETLQVLRADSRSTKHCFLRQLLSPGSVGILAEKIRDRPTHPKNSCQHDSGDQSAAVGSPGTSIGFPFEPRQPRPEQDKRAGRSNPDEQRNTKAPEKAAS